MTVKAVFFDIGKTLVDDPFPKAKYAVGEFLVKIGRLSESQSDSFIDILTKENLRIDSYEFSHYWGEEEIFESAIGQCGICNGEQVSLALAAYRQEVQRLYRNDPSLKALSNEELLTLLSWLRDEKKLVLGVISDERISSIGLYWDILQCSDYFPVVVTSEEIGCSKPCEPIFNYALMKANVKADESVYIGDNLNRDIEGANGVGMVSILFTKFVNGSSDFRPRYVINDLRKLRPIIEELGAGQF